MSEDNKKITQLDAFADKFLAKCLLGEMINRYMVLVASEQKLLVMRPYQIYAVKAIVDCIHQNRGNGYIWHTTGSGKARLIELDPKYVDVIVRRWQGFSEGQATRQSDGVAFDNVLAEHN